MQGEYRGDFTRDTFDKTKHFLRVLRQQGRVSLEADFNEQAAILLHYLQALAADLIGPHGGPADGFKINGLMKDGKPVPNDFQIGAGHYYVDGILCENDTRQDAAGKPVDTTYFTQPNYPLDKNSDRDKLPQGSVLVYLDVWERLITYIEDDSIREVALGGPDTASRSKVIWQVKTTNEISAEKKIPIQTPTESWRTWVDENWAEWMAQWQPANRGMLKARVRVKPQDVSTDPCITSPESRYRGAENQLYRVEIHKSGTARNGKDDDNGGNAKDAATFKWSRENGSVTFPIRSLPGTTATLEHLGRDKHLSLAPGDWVEIVDEHIAMSEKAGPLAEVDTVNRDDLSITLKLPDGASALPNYTEADMATKHPLLRRWDHKAGDSTQGGLQLQEGAALIEEGADENGWIELEDGIQIQFQSGATYRSGDYWLIPARTATGDVEWPKETDGDGKLILDKDNRPIPAALPPHGVEHHYAPLSIITLDQGGKVTATQDLRRKIIKIWE